ncbi:MAG: hypothetical protein IKG46_13845 [Solobacterium sp.]|nr:hypothetical protein [Solobacterium sp.]
MALEKDILKSWRIIQLGEISYSEACAAFSDTAAQVRDHDPEEVQGAFDTLLEILSPDLHPDLQRNKDALSLWAAVVRAYVLNDLDYLKIVASFKADLVQVFNLLNEPVLSDLEKRIDELKKRINGYSDCEEFGFSSILADPRRIEEEKKRLTTQIQYFADSILEFEQKLDSFPILRMLS